MAEPNDRIGAYRLVRRLGSGGMGEVFLAWDDRLERPVAAKRIRPDRGGGDGRRERFRREARAVARLSHPNVVQIFDLVEGDEDWIVMEHVQGRTLAEILRERGALPQEVAVDLARQVAEGLAAAHAQGMVHRDLKAENVMVTPEGRAKILDFGLARPLEEDSGETLTEDGVVVGTWRSMSPEQAAGGVADARSDLFSLGVLLYEMSTGRSPFLGRTPAETLRRLGAEAPEPLRGVVPELASLVAALLEKEPARRPESAERVARELRELAARPDLAPAVGWSPSPPPGSGETQTMLATTLRPTDGKEGGNGSRSRMPSRRSSWIAAAVAALALAVALGALWIRRERLEETRLLRVAVLSPRMQGEAGEGLSFAAFGALASLRRTVLGLSHVTMVDPAQTRGVAGGVPEIARAVAADEVIETSLAARDREVWVTLRRLRGRDGAMLAKEEARGSLGRDGALALARGIGSALRRMYAGRGIRAGSPPVEASARDYADYLEVQRRTEAGKSAWAPELDHLDRIVASSPRFLDAYVKSASLAVNLYDDTKDPAYLERARSALRRARLLAPEAVEVVGAEVRLAIKEGDWAGADQLLAELDRISPGDAVASFLRSSLASQRGHLDEAALWMRKAVGIQPTWRNFTSLAELEARTGQLAAARLHLGEALHLVPGNTFVVAKIGEVELAYGNLSQAEAIYRGLVASGPQRSDLTNLGLVHFLLGRYEDAAADYRRALKIDPGHVTATLNLADAETAMGHHREAAVLRRQVLAALEAKEHGASLLPIEKTFRAQCLVYLGESRKGVDIALAALQESPEDADVVYQTALILALAGEKASALSLARKAVALGYQPRWLTVPAFTALRSDPAFERLKEP